MVVTLMVITTTVRAKATPRQYNVTEIYQCQRKAYDSHSCKALSKMLRVTNASMWEEKNI